MPFPERSPLTLPVRRFIMVALITLFFIIAPLIILYTAGFRYNFRDKRVEQTGVISIDAKPLDVEVFLNTVKIEKNMPIRLANRAPGTYRLVFKKKGYQTWERDITVTSQQTTYIKNVTLFKETLPASLFETPLQNVQSFSGATDGSSLITITQENGTDDVSLITTRTKRKTLLKRVRHDAITDVRWSPAASTAAIVTADGNDTIIDVVDGTQEKIVATARIATGTSTLEIHWPKEETGVLIRDRNRLFTLSGDGEQTIATLSSDTRGWYRDDNGRVWSLNNRLQLTAGEETLQLPPDTLHIIDLNQSRIITKTSSGVSILARNDGHETNAINVDHVRWNAATREWIAWSASELWTIYEDGHTVLLNRTSEKITDVVPLDAFGVLLLSTKSILLGFNPGYYVTHTLLHSATIDAIVVNQRLHTIYFLGEIGNRRDIFELPY